MSDVQIVQLLGLIYLGLGLGFFLNPKALKKVLEGFTDSLALGYIGGIAAMIVGYAIIMHHNIWAWQWLTIVTVVGWIAFIKGYTLLVFPQWSADMAKKMAKCSPFMKGIPYVAMFLGGAMLIISRYFM